VPLARAVLKLKLELTETGVLLVPLFCRTTVVPDNNPDTPPPTVKVGAAGEPPPPPQAAKHDARAPTTGRIRRFHAILETSLDQ
jgi:hypothetical protein